MNVAWFIGRRFYSYRSPQGQERLAVRIATLGIAVGLCISLLSVCIGLGFKNEVAGKILGFAGHAQVVDSRSVLSSRSYPVLADETMLRSFRETANVDRVMRFSQKVGILKTETDFKDILIKGIAEDYDTLFLHDRLIDGCIPQFSANQSLNDIVLSSLQARELGLKVGDRVYAYFFEGTMKTRRFNVAGIYETNFNQFDNTIVLGNLYTVNSLNGWQADLCSGLEITTCDFNRLAETSLDISRQIALLSQKDGNTLSCFTIREMYGQIFEWLRLLDLNMLVILCLMLCVACCTVVSGLLITILQRTSAIGILKAIGSRGRQVRRIFLNYSFLIIVRGIVIGNIIGLGLSLLQQQFNIFGLFIHLDPQSYYVDRVPILFNWSAILLLNLATLLVAMLALIAPSYIVARITPVKAIRTE